MKLNDAYWAILVFFLLVSTLSQAVLATQPPKAAPAPSRIDPLLSEKITSQAQLNALWKKYNETKDARYLNLIISTFANIANDDQFEPDDILYLATVFLTGGPIFLDENNTVTTNNEDLKKDKLSREIILKYNSKGILAPLVVSTTALMSLGVNSTKDPKIIPLIEQYIKLSHNQKINSALQKIVFRSRYPKIIQGQNCWLFTTQTKENALAAFKIKEDLNLTYRKAVLYSQLNQLLKNEFTPLEDIRVDVVWASTATDNISLDITIKQPDGSIFQKFSSKDLLRNISTSYAIISIDSGGLTQPGIYAVQVDFEKNGVKETLTHYFLFNLL